CARSVVAPYAMDYW
nr:immunoglobulin heavy chain junction region [Mus musculus]